MTYCIVCHSSKLNKMVYDHHHLNQNNAPSLDTQQVNSLVPNNFIFKGFVDVCTECGHGVLHSMPSDAQINDFYNASFWGRDSLLSRVQSATEGKFSDVHLARAKHQQEFISRHHELSNLDSCLEIGAGDALLSQALKRMSSDNSAFYLCEPGSHWDKYYKSLGLNKIADFFPFTSKQCPFELIVASHWLEHIVNIETTFRVLKSQLEKGGKLFLEVPNAAHNYWQLNIKDTPHVHFFTPSSLEKIAESAGFKVLEVAEFGIPFEEHVAGKKPTYNELKQRQGGYSICAMFENI